MIDNANPMQDIYLDIGIYNTMIQELKIKDNFCKHVLDVLNKNYQQFEHSYFVRYETSYCDMSLTPNKLLRQLCSLKGLPFIFQVSP